mmetsp:Transcript_15804/g.35841  ORF Transcript_15804/g.35841 Transcript_15804/m.35841 type:complete len:248 (-) Transcript_15804:18-761(-)
MPPLGGPEDPGPGLDEDRGVQQVAGRLPISIHIPARVWHGAWHRLHPQLRLHDGDAELLRHVAVLKKLLGRGVADDGVAVTTEDAAALLELHDEHLGLIRPWRDQRPAVDPRGTWNVRRLLHGHKCHLALRCRALVLHIQSQSAACTPRAIHQRQGTTAPPRLPTRPVLRVDARGARGSALGVELVLLVTDEVLPLAALGVCARPPVLPALFRPGNKDDDGRDQPAGPVQAHRAERVPNWRRPSGTH